MGFGIAFLGYCFLLLHPLGMGVIASPMLAYGFFLASRLDRYFAYSALSALFLLPRGLFMLLGLLLPFLGVETDLAVMFPYLDLVTYMLFFVHLCYRNSSCATPHKWINNCTFIRQNPYYIFHYSQRHLTRMFCFFFTHIFNLVYIPPVIKFCPPLVRLQFFLLFFCH